MGSFPSHDAGGVHPAPSSPTHPTHHHPAQLDGEVSSATSFRNSAAAPPTGSGGGGDGGGAMARMRARHTLPKKLLKGRIVFLGLDGAGKTTLIQQLLRHGGSGGDDDAASADGEGEHHDDHAAQAMQLQSGSSVGDLTAMMMNDDKTTTSQKMIYPEPTKHTKSVAYRLASGKYVQLVDVPGGRAHRGKWRSAIHGDVATNTTGTRANGSGSGTSSSGDTVSTQVNAANVPIVGVVFVIDAKDRTRFPLVAHELVKFQKLKDALPQRSSNSTATTALQRAPFFLLLNKLDSASGGNGDGAATPSLEQRRESRAMREELKKAFDHQLRMDQKRHPRDYPVPSPAEIAKGAGGTNGHYTPPSPPTMAAASSSTGMNGPPAPTQMTQATPMAHKKTMLAEANNNRKVMLMTSIVECCAYDLDCIRSLHGSLQEEIQKLWAA